MSVSALCSRWQLYQHTPNRSAVRRDALFDVVAPLLAKLHRLLVIVS